MVVCRHSISKKCTVHGVLLFQLWVAYFDNIVNGDISMSITELVSPVGQ